MTTSADFVAIVDAQSDEQVTFFELLTAMAFSAFADTPVEVGVIEFGMGGTWTPPTSSTAWFRW